MMKAHLVGGGLASLAAAAWLIRDAGFLAGNIRIYEASDGLGGAMALAGGPDTGYILPTGRVFEAQYRCAFDLLSMVPSVSDPSISIKDEILAFNQRYGYFDRAHVLDRDLAVVHSAHFGLSVEDRLALLRLAIKSEAKLEGVRIEECFSEAFFSSEFWFLWAPLMGPLRQHSALEMRRFINRFLHLTADLSAMTMVYRTRYNQYDSIVRPIVDWLRRQGVELITGAAVTNVEFAPSRNEITAVGLEFVQGGRATKVEVGQGDIVLVTNGSQTTDLCVGSMTQPPTLALTGRSFSLWQNLARNRPEFGRPDVFFGEARVPDTKWVTFTVTTGDATFFELMTKLSGSEPGRGGFMTLRDSAWLLTLAIFHQPEFVGQPQDVMAWWGFGMRPDRLGDFIAKPMAACSGAEILDEVLQHLKFDAARAAIIATSTCIPCMLPYANSVWMPRRRTDRPLATPKGSTNFGFIGQFCEIPEDTIFTMEYSVRSARQAVSTLLGLSTTIPPVYQGQRDFEAVLQALKAMA
ncbi:MAG TPA: oleate hydratase [Caulobacteraceae bacterium]|nr:oleate hydratase [Caulobacteraceae bacterium]